MTIEQRGPAYAERRTPPLRNETDRDLVTRAQAGDARAFGALWSRHVAFATRYAASVTSTIDADDLASEAFARIFTAVQAQGGPRGDFRPYLAVTIRNLAAEWGRARREFTGLDQERIESLEGEGSAGPDEDADLVMRAFASLPRRWQVALWYTEVEELPLADVATALGINVNAVSQLTFRAREGLRAAWIQEHLPLRPTGSDCRWAVERMGAYERRRLGKRERTRIETHVADCSDCVRMVQLAEQTGSRLRAVLLPLMLGGGYAAWESAGAPEHASAAPTHITPGSLPHASRWDILAQTSSVLAVGALLLGAFAGSDRSQTRPAAVRAVNSSNSADSATGQGTPGAPRATMTIIPGTSPKPARHHDPGRSSGLATSNRQDAGQTSPPGPSRILAFHDPSDTSLPGARLAVSLADSLVSTGHPDTYSAGVTISNLGDASAEGARFFVPAPTGGYYSVAGAWSRPDVDDPNIALDEDGAAGTNLTLSMTLDPGAEYTFSILLRFDPATWSSDSGDGCQVARPPTSVTVQIVAPDGNPIRENGATVVTGGAKGCDA